MFQRVSLLVLSLSFSLMVGACSKKSGGGDSLPLMPDTQQLYDGNVTDEECELASHSGEDDFCTRDVVSVVDVARDGQRLALVMGHGKTLVSVLVSEDLGATWTRHDVKSAFNSNIEGTDAFTMDRYGIHIVGPKIYLLLGSIHLGAGAQSYPGWQVADLDLTTNTYTILGQLDGVSVVALTPDHLATFSMTRNPAADGYGSYGVETYGLDTNKETSQTMTCGASVKLTCSLADFYPAPDGSFVGFDSIVDPMLGAETCLSTVAVGGVVPSVSCVPSGEWPPEAPGQTLVTDGAVLSLYGSGGNAYAIGIQGGKTLGPLYLGTGTPHADEVQTNHHRWAGGAAVDDGHGVYTLVKLDGGAVKHLPVPPTPCSSGPCGETRFAWALPLDNDDYLTFYVVNSFPGGRHDHLLVRKAHAPLEALSSSGGSDAGVAKFARYPTAVEGGALEKACARFVGCVGGASLYSVLGCVDFWKVLRGGTPATDLAYQHFVATPDGCGSFAATWPEAWGAAPAPGCAPGCFGDGLVSSCQYQSSPTSIPDTNCGGHGVTCLNVGGANVCSAADAMVADCNKCDAKGRAVTCYPATRITSVSDCAAMGYQCQMVGGTPTCGAPLCTATTGSCDGDIATNCLANRLPTRQDCSRVAGTPCDPNVGVCRAAPKSGGCNVSGIICLDNALIYCVGNDTHYVDCTGVGFSGCTILNATNPQLATCSP